MQNINSQCRVCDNLIGNEILIVREMMYGTREEFTYFRCSSCGCVQIMNVPEDISKYYPRNSYYSFQRIENQSAYWYEWIKRLLKPMLFNIFCTKCSFLLKTMPFFRRLNDLDWLNFLVQEKIIKKSMSVLDIGSGSGMLLKEMNTWGFENLIGIDPFIEKDLLIHMNKREVKIFKQDVFNHVGMYDLIMLHHSFEHMDNPHLVLKKLYGMMNQSGFLLIRIPVSDSFAFRKYGSNWFQLDAPRHFYLHTTRSMVSLSKKAGLVLNKIIYDSTAGQLFKSQKYCQDISLGEKTNFSPCYMQYCKKQAVLLNQMMDGDQACFIFSKGE